VEGEEDKRWRGRMIRGEGGRREWEQEGMRRETDTHTDAKTTKEVVEIRTFSLRRGLLRGVAGMLLIAGLGRGVAALLRLEKRLAIRHCSAGGSNEE